MASSKEFQKWFLLGLATLVAALYLRIILPLVLPLLLACVTAVLFFPVHRWIVKVCCGWSRVAAVITTILVLMTVLLPIGVGVAVAGTQLLQASQKITPDLEVLQRPEELLQEPDGNSPRWLRELRSRVSREQLQQLREMAADGLSTGARMTYQKTTGFIADAFSFLVAICIFLVATYYFFAEHEKFLRALERFSPLTVEDDRLLRNTFVEVSRGVLLGSVAAALLQAILVGVALAVLGIEQALLLGLIAFFLAMIPYLGSAIIWVPVALGFFWNGDYGKATMLTLYGVLVVSTVDNLIRAYLLKDHGQLHPLVALVSIVGALQFVGFWGIVVGPVVASFLYALLEMLKTKTGDNQQLVIQPP